MLDIAQLLRDEISPELLGKHSATERVRDDPHPLVFWTFLEQVAGEDSSCKRAVSRVQSWAHQQGLKIPSASTSSFCEARQALPLEMLQAVHHSLSDLGSGDIHVSDRLYSSYEIIARHLGKGVHSIGRPHQARKIDYRKGPEAWPERSPVKIVKTPQRAQAQPTHQRTMGRPARQNHPLQRP